MSDYVICMCIGSILTLLAIGIIYIFVVLEKFSNSIYK